MTREAGTRYPQLFAALSPWNAPPAETWPGFAEGGWQMPCFIYLGDNDPVARGTEEPLLEQMLRANCCAAVRTAGGFVPDAIYNGENHYTAARGYTEGERFGTAVYRDAQGVPRVASDNAWALKRAGAGKSLHLTAADIDFNGYIPKTIKFTATVTLRDGMGNVAAEEQAIFEY